MTEMMELDNKKNVKMIIVNTFHMFKKVEKKHAYDKEMKDKNKMKGNLQS